MTTPEEPITTPVDKKKFVTKPDDAAFQKSLNELNSTIDSLKGKIAAVNEKMSASDSIKSSFSSVRQELKSKMDDINRQKNEINEQRNGIMEKLKSLQSEIKRKTDQVKASKDKIGFKSVLDIDLQIKSLEKQLESGTLSLFEEKKVVGDISNLKKQKKNYESLNSQQSTVQTDKLSLDELRPKLKELDQARDALRAQGDEIRAQLDAVQKDSQSKMGRFSHLIAERTNLRSEMDKAYDQLKELKTNHKKARDEYNVWYREEAARKQELYKQRQKEERDEKLRLMAEKELELAAIPAFTDEINLCSVLTARLSGLLPENNKDSNVLPESDKEGASLAAPEGSVLMKKKSDRDEDFFAARKPKKSAKRSSTLPDKIKPLKLDIEMIDQFSKLDIEIPVSGADIPKTLTSLEAKKTFYLENQAAKTLEAQEAAKAKIEALKKVEQTETVAVVAQE